MQTVTAEQSAAQLPPLISREVLFGNPERTSPRLAPDGKYLVQRGRNNPPVQVASG